ncbi:hypothetical protein F4802DRAFT_575671 [Xylaria palmicola]|nr:hypothetical protein F4802DRAFT_575671 [Xylaria palmicola]
MPPLVFLRIHVCTVTGTSCTVQILAVVPPNCRERSDAYIRGCRNMPRLRLWGAQLRAGQKGYHCVSFYLADWANMEQFFIVFIYISMLL